MQKPLGKSDRASRAEAYKEYVVGFLEVATDEDIEAIFPLLQTLATCNVAFEVACDILVEHIQSVRAVRLWTADHPEQKEVAMLRLVNEVRTNQIAAFPALMTELIVNERARTGRSVGGAGQCECDDCRAERAAGSGGSDVSGEFVH